MEVMLAILKYYSRKYQRLLSQYGQLGALHGFLSQVIGATIEAAGDTRLEDAVRAFKHLPIDCRSHEQHDNGRKAASRNHRFNQHAIDTMIICVS
jgi:hypothetical protein